MRKNTPSVSRDSSLFTGMLLFCFAAVYLFFFFRVLGRVGDEGTLVYGAQLVSQGALPYRDFFEVMGPGSFYWLGLFFKLFGTNILVARGLLLATAVSTITLLYWMTRRIYQGPLDLIPSLFFLIISFPMWPATSHHWDSNLFALLSVAAFFLWQDRRRWWLLALAGGLAGLTSCFLQQKGLFLVVALALAILVNGWRQGETRTWIVHHLSLLLGCYAAVGALVVLFFWGAGALPDLIYATLIFPLTRYNNVNQLPYGFGLKTWVYPCYRDGFQALLPLPLSEVLPLLMMIPLAVIFCLPLLLVGLAGFSCLHRARRTVIFSPIMFPYWTAGIALWIAEFHRKDILHLIYGSPLLLILFFFFWNLSPKRVFKDLVLGLIIFTLVLFGSLNLLIAMSANHKIASRRGVIYGQKEDPALNFLINHTNPGDYVFIYPYYPMYYFLADVKNPTRYSILLYHINTKAQFDEAIRALEQKQVKYVLWDTVVAGSNLKTWFPQYIQPPNDKLHLEHYLEDHYETIGILNGFKILHRLGAPGCLDTGF
jgi:4-amino-4-deoxy-L-arabinose transferase-like glycosyltransferase